MARLPRNSRSRAVLAVVVAALAPLGLATGCSSADDAASAEQDAGFGSGTGDPTGDGDPSSDDGDAGETGSPGDGDGDGDDETDPVGVEDPSVELGECQLDATSLLAQDLHDAQVELPPTLVRESVLAGSGAVPLIPLTAQPFLNHFEFNYAAGEGPELDVVGELWKPPSVNADAPSRYRLQFAVRAPAAAPQQRPPVDLVVVVDLGPSMAGEPLALAQEALTAIDSALNIGDRVTLIGAGEQPELLVDGLVIDALDLDPLTGLLQDLGPAGVAKVDAALSLAYETLTPAWDGQGQPRVLLISNGHFQVDDGLLATVDDQAADGRYLAAIGVGEPGMIVANALAQLAGEGRGPLLYDRSAEEIWTDLSARFATHMLAAATELELTVELPPGLSIRDRDLLEPNRSETELALLGVGEQLVVHHELETCAELDPEAAIRVTVEWNDPSTGEAKQTIWDQPVAELGFGSMDTRKGMAAVAYVRALRAYRDGDPSASYSAVLDAISMIAEALETQPEDPDLIEMSQVLGKLEG